MVDIVCHRVYVATGSVVFGSRLVASKLTSPWLERSPGLVPLILGTSQRKDSCNRGMVFASDGSPCFCWDPKRWALLQWPVLSVLCREWVPLPQGYERRVFTLLRSPRVCVREHRPLVVTTMVII